MLPDCDVPGIAHGEKVCRALLSQGCEVYVVEADDFGYQIATKHGKDISDWLDAAPSRDRTEVEALLNSAAKVEPATKAQKTAAQPPPEPTEEDPRPVIRCARGGRGNGLAKRSRCWSIPARGMTGGVCMAVSA